jgi:outer membrane protein OmpA-like peptidoglycan-associated protein
LIQRLLLTVSLIILAVNVVAQPSVPDRVIPRFQSGARVSYLNNRHHTQANIFCCTECGTFSDGSGSGYMAEVFAEMPMRFLPELSFTLGLGASDKGGDFGEATTDNLPVQDPNSGAYVPLVRDHAYAARLRYGTIVPGLRYQPLSEYPLYVAGGMEIQIPFGSATTYTQTESIRSPVGVLYPETNTQTRTVGEGVISGVAMSYAARGTLGYRLPISQTLDIAPELSYSYPLTDVESAFKWRVTSIAAGVALRWHGARETPDTTRAPVLPPPVLAAHVTHQAAPTITLGVAAGTPPIRVIETTVTETFPILPYIFFDSASDGLPVRLLKLTSEEAGNFAEGHLPHRSLESYYSILNVVGSRLRANPKATLTITGTTDGREAGSSALASALARSRALSVRKYLVDVWHIAPERLRVTTTDQPANPSSTEYAQGFEENRRVELTSNADEILKPIVHERFREASVQPKVIPIWTVWQDAGVVSWRVTVSTHGTTVFERAGVGSPPDTIKWFPEESDLDRLAALLSERDSVTIDVLNTMPRGGSSTSSVSIPASRTTNPFELSRLSLIVFDFDQSTLSEQNQRMIARFVGKSIYPASTESIVGSTDNLGELKHNEKLSRDRAMNVRDLILKQKPDARILRTEGIGPSNLLYDNTLPEGRYYCRTVKVEVETPLEAVLPKP